LIPVTLSCGRWCFHCRSSRSGWASSGYSSAGSTGRCTTCWPGRPLSTPGMHREFVSGVLPALAPREPVPDVVVGAGHNGLVAACYLARGGRCVVVLEALPAPGGGSRPAETIPGFRFDLHSVAHNMINMTAIPEELDLAGVGLVYQEMDPFTVAIHEDGRRVRFHRSVDATV